MAQGPAPPVAQGMSPRNWPSRPGMRAAGLTAQAQAKRRPRRERHHPMQPRAWADTIAPTQVAGPDCAGATTLSKEGEQRRHRHQHTAAGALKAAPGPHRHTEAPHRPLPAACRPTPQQRHTPAEPRPTSSAESTCPRPASDWVAWPTRCHADWAGWPEVWAGGPSRRVGAYEALEGAIPLPRAPTTMPGKPGAPLEAQGGVGRLRGARNVVGAVRAMACAYT